MPNKVEAWEEIFRETVFQKDARGIEKVDFKLPDGTVSDFYIKKEGSAASILAITNKNKIIVTKQFRPGPKQILSELPGGFIDPNEKPEETITRELLEETGYSGNVEFVTTCIDDAYSTMRRYCFVATNCEKVSKPNMGDKEFVEIELLTLTEFRKLLRSGEMTDVEVGYLGLDYLNLL